MLIYLKEYFFKRVTDAYVLHLSKLFCFLGQFASSGARSYAFVSTGRAKALSFLPAASDSLLFILSDDASLAFFSGQTSSSKGNNECVLLYLFFCVSPV